MKQVPLFPPEERMCRYCNQAKSLEEFRFQVGFQCKDCHRAQMKFYNEQHREQLAERSRVWYRENKTRRKQYDTEHRDKRRKQRSRWALSNPEKYRAKNRAKSARRRALRRESNGTFTPRDIIAIYENQKGACFYCMDDLGNNYHIDHFMPLSRGGDNSPSNLRLACPKCNTLKGASYPHEFIQRAFLRLF